jgi:hypothetical protein
MQLKLITTVTTAASSYDLTTLANVKTELGLSDGSQDATLKRYIAYASAAAAQYCNRKFQVETIEDQIWPASQLTPVAATFETLQLSRWPEVSIVSFTEDGTALVEGTDYVIEKDVGQAIRLDAQSGRRRRWNATPKVVQYTAGYSAIPSEVEDAVIRMVTRRFRAKGRDPNLRQQNIPGVLEQSWWIATGSDSGNLTPDIVDLLDNYRAPVIA